MLLVGKSRFIYLEIDFLQAVQREGGAAAFFFDASYKYSFEVFAYVRPAETVKEYAAFLPYLLAYSIGGMYSMVLKWVESGMEVPSAVLIEKLKDGFTSPDF